MRHIWSLAKPGPFNPSFNPFTAPRQAGSAGSARLPRAGYASLDGA